MKKLTNNELKRTQGGYSAGECGTAIAGGIGSSTLVGASGGPAGAFLGAHVGLLGGSAFCIGGFLGSIGKH